jgi:hypothetical protein
MKGKLAGFVVTGLIILVFVAISWRVPFIKKIVYGA